MVSYFDDNDNAPSEKINIEAKGFETAEVYLLDAAHDMEKIGTEKVQSGRISLDIPLYGTYLIKLSKGEM